MGTGQNIGQVVKIHLSDPFAEISGKIFGVIADEGIEPRFEKEFVGIAAIPFFSSRVLKMAAAPQVAGASYSRYRHPSL